jgi:hypothetical protein
MAVYSKLHSGICTLSTKKNNKGGKTLETIWYILYNYIIIITTIGGIMNAIKRLLSGIGFLLLAIICYFLAQSLSSPVLFILLILSLFLGVVFLISGNLTKD